MEMAAGTRHGFQESSTFCQEERNEASCSSNEDEVYSDYDDDDVYQVFEELDFSQLPDTNSISSKDSFYPPDNSAPNLRSQTPEPLTFFMACCNNNSIIVKFMIRQGVTKEQVQEVDKNNRTGLIVACYQGYVDVVIALSQCPFIDVNWQDSEGNTALMTAAQAGHLMITNYLLNYYSGLDIEHRNCHGFTAVMKAALQGRADCVRALTMSGADVEVRDYGRKMTPFEWALYTGRHETARMMQRLAVQPCAEQFCDSFTMEWPLLKELVLQAQKPQPCWKQLLEQVCDSVSLVMGTSPREGGVLDYMVRMTTALASPLVATACSTVCPGSPPCAGKRRPAVPDILRENTKLDKHNHLILEGIQHHKRLFQIGTVPILCRKGEGHARVQQTLALGVALAPSVVLRRISLLPLMRRSSVGPGLVVPKLCLCRASLQTYTPERNPHRRSKDSQYLQVPKCNYKAEKEEQRNKLRWR